MGTLFLCTLSFNGGAGIILEIEESGLRHPDTNSGE
jgi:hypothetical protein